MEGGLPKRLEECGADWDGVTADRMKQVDSLTGWTMQRWGGWGASREHGHSLVSVLV